MYRVVINGNDFEIILLWIDSIGDTVLCASANSYITDKWMVTLHLIFHVSLVGSYNLVSCSTEGFVAHIAL